jgi:hypothetical protein
MNVETLGQLNWLAMIVGAAIYFALGAVWYMPAVLGRPWQRAIGWDESKRPPESSAVTYIAPAIFYLVAAIVTGMLAAATGSDTLGEGIVLGLAVAIGYALVITATDAVFDPNKPQPWVWFAITGAYHVIGLVIVAVVVSVWQ